MRKTDFIIYDVLFYERYVEIHQRINEPPRMQESSLVNGIVESIFLYWFLVNFCGWRLVLGGWVCSAFEGGGSF